MDKIYGLHKYIPYTRDNYVAFFKDFLDKLSIVKIELDELCRCSEINFHEYIRINLK